MPRIMEAESVGLLHVLEPVAFLLIFALAVICVGSSANWATGLHIRDKGFYQPSSKCSRYVAVLHPLPSTDNRIHYLTSVLANTGNAFRFMGRLQEWNGGSRKRH